MASEFTSEEEESTLLVGVPSRWRERIARVLRTVVARQADERAARTALEQELAETKARVARYEESYREYRTLVPLTSAYRAGLEAAAAWHEARAAALEAQASTLKCLEDAEDLRAVAAAERQDAATLRRLFLPESFSEAERNAEERRARAFEQEMSSLRAARDREAARARHYQMLYRNTLTRTPSK